MKRLFFWKWFLGLTVMQWTIGGGERVDAFASM
jgi:hypothetical protein